MEEAGIMLDSSLGFSKVIGYRNSYSRPVKVFDIRQNKPLDLVEVPLNIMDTTLMDHMKVSIGEMLETITAFIDSSPTGSLTTLLFHNNYLTDMKYRKYSEVYEGLLSWMKDQEILVTEN